MNMKIRNADGIRRCRGGFTLVEVCVAIAIVAMGILTAMSILLPALKWANDANNEMTVATAIENALTNLEASAGYTGPNTTYPYMLSSGPFAVQVFSTVAVTDPASIKSNASSSTATNAVNWTTALPAAGSKSYATYWAAVFRRQRSPTSSGYIDLASGVDPLFVTKLNVYRP